MGRNLVKVKRNLMTSPLIPKYDVIIVILMSRQFVLSYLGRGSLYGFFVLDRLS